VDSYNSATPQQSKNIPSTAIASSQLRNYLHFGAFHLDVERRELFKDGVRVKAQSKVIEALLILVEHPGQIITREILRARLWPNETQINYDANVNTTVNKLRHILGDSHDRPRYVETIPRRGYAFIATARLVEESPFVSRERSTSAPGLLEDTTSPVVESFFGAFATSRWFRVGAISLFVGAVLFGAAVVLFVHRGY
jgi:DNA-binding winged helix-turn-helix (wHTH) protein